MPEALPLVWVLADDRAGNVAQALGVAEALGWPFERKNLSYTRLAGLPNALRGASLLGVVKSCRDALSSPWPDLVIAAGRRTAPVARWIRRQHPATRLCQVMDPGWPGREDFALIAVPNHDADVTAAPNLLRITGAPHRVTPERLACEADIWRPRLEHLPRPWIALIVGGATKSHTFTATQAQRLAELAGGMAREAGGSLLVTSSRRTGAEAESSLAAYLPRPLHWFRWGDGGDNPYFGYLALADHIVVTGDSVSMVCEACATPAPVSIFAPTGMIGAKHRRLHADLVAKGFARMLDGKLEGGTHPPLNAARVVADRLRGLMA